MSGHGCLPMLCLLAFPLLALAAPLVNPLSLWTSASPPVKSNTDSIVCVGCTVIVGEITVNFEKNESSVNHFVDNLCNLLAGLSEEASSVCKELWNVFGDTILQMLDNKESPDDICRFIRLCNNATCNLYAQPKPRAQRRYSIVRSPTVPIGRVHFEWPWTAVIDHYPAEDLDGDHYSSMETLRGGHWRGKDCDDTNSDVYPGRNSSEESYLVDTNCNGIYGGNATGSYEDIFCKNSGQRGLIVLGDSASAHFHIPRNFTSAEQIAEIAEDEGDFPECSWSTGHIIDGCPQTPSGTGGMTSLYYKLWQRNHCNFRDFENISVNGARSSAMIHSILNTTARNPSTDYPAIVVYALVGNDVCNPHVGFGHMTTPAEFHENVMTALKILDNSILPSGSHVILLGLEHGEMWNYMHDVLYPGLSTSLSNVTYANMWEFVSCLGVNPCWGWLHSSESVRNKTNSLARSLDQVLVEIAQNANNGTYKFTTFDVIYIENPDLYNTQQWMASGGDPTDMFEWIGGGHPSQLQHQMTAEYIWNYLEKNYPDVLGPVNPLNEEIEKKFGNQGGY